MPRIDPVQLLKCLSVLLSPTGGIKSAAEVQRLASLMTKFSKKLVSKCIYVQILKQTESDLLKMFMTSGGWNLIHTWLSDAVVAKNWPLIEQLLELLLMCPVDVELLKTNSCPKLVKGLSKESLNDCVKQLACRLVEQWLRMVKGETGIGAVPAAAAAAVLSSAPAAEASPASTSLGPVSSTAALEALPADTGAEPEASSSEPPVLVAEESRQEVVQDAVADVADVAEDGLVDVKSEASDEKVIVEPSVVECKEEVEESKKPEDDSETVEEIVGHEVEDLDSEVKKEETATSEDSGEEVVGSEDLVGQLPVYKITIRDGKQVLAKVHSGEKPQKSVVTPVAVDSEEEMPSVKPDAIVSLKKLDLTTDVEESVPKKKFEQTKVTRSQKSLAKIDRSESVSSEDDSVKPSKSRKKSKEQKKLEKNIEKSKTKAAPKAKDISPKGKPMTRKEKIAEQFKMREKEKKKEREKNEQKYYSGSDLDEKDKALLAKLIPPAISKLGKIPKKKKPEEIEKNDTKKPEDMKKASEKKPEESKKASEKKPEESKKAPERKPEELKKAPEKKPEETKKINEKKLPPPPPPPSEPKKTASISIEVRKPSTAPRPKTVKTYHSKFRSTGLEEELKPPVPRAAVAVKKPVPVPLLEKKPPVKRPSPTRDVPVEKKLKIDITPEKEKVGGAKLIPPRPKPFLQESDMFMDALTASSRKEPRKRKRRASSSGKEGPDAKKDAAGKEDEGKATTPPGSPGEDASKSPSSVKPAFKFYQDTLEVDDDKDTETKVSKDQESNDSGESDENNKSQESLDADEALEEAVSAAVRDDTVTSTSELEDSGAPRACKGVLVYHKVHKGPKKSVHWKPEKELIDVQFFELDETERVNVTKTFTDMKQMERTHEREAFLLARKLPQDDTMEEKTPWRPPVPIDLPPSVVEPGMNSREKDVQYAREKTVLRALYFNNSLIPDSPAEPDLEIHATTDPVVIPLEDASGGQESVNDFTGQAWPEPKPLLPPSPPHTPQYRAPVPQPLLGPPLPVASPQHQPQFPPYQQFPVQPGVMFPGQGMPMMGPTPPPMMGGMPMMQQHPSMPQPAGDWRTGDGKVVNMNEMPMEMYNQGGPGPGMPGPGPGMPGPGMPMGMGMGGMPGQDMNYNMMGGEMGGFPQQGFPMGGGPPMFQPQPPMPPQQQQFPPRGNPNNRRGMRGNRRGWGVQNWQGNRGRGGNWGVGGGAGNPRPSLCKHFRSGYCRTGDDCPFLHPGVNGPQF
ncbi:serine/threonine-protein phosphatase 1 regulatory subunit 10-like isoform X2 [Bacillus rossius redtenbacheri]|uniref:serine/threonine-protein phosphatase 1 regulatory subunit 10-like isoform X2 n=1 Tax=Bacillus rossius redtenbacheri TaxID=93214 RepID=UPI002FDDBB9C